MIYTEKIKDAIRFATKTHEIYQKQKRKGKDIAYITHPLAVGVILARAGASEDVIVAGILHDTIEDSISEKKVTPKMLEERFGKRVADLVVSVTEPNKDLSWAERKHAALLVIERYDNDSILLKSADVINNLTELLDDYEREGEVIWQRFNAPKDDILNHARFVTAALARKWNANPLQTELLVINESVAKLQMKQVGEVNQVEFGFIPRPLAIANRPELRMFPLNILFGKSGYKGGKPVRGIALYEPDLTTFGLKDKEFTLTYRNKYGGTHVVIISFNTETSTYRGEKFIDGISVGQAYGALTNDVEKSWYLFFAHLTLLGLQNGEACEFEYLTEESPAAGSAPGA